MQSFVLLKLVNVEAGQELGENVSPTLTMSGISSDIIANIWRRGQFQFAGSCSFTINVTM
jgi:hypothetical protein